MSGWQRVPTPRICERLIGFSVPRDGEVLAISYEAVHLLRMGSAITVETDPDFCEYDIYDHKSGVARYRGREYQIVGLHGGRPLLDSPQGERIVLDRRSQLLSVTRHGATIYSTRYENFSGDWAAATFSPDGRFIVLGCPYDFDFMVLRREAPA